MSVSAISGDMTSAPVPGTSAGGLLGAIEPGSPADRAGLRSGERVVSVRGIPLRDVIDFRWLTDEASATVGIVSDAEGERDVTLTREPGEAWGLEFASPVFDRVRTCGNACTFCFVAQLPKGLRASLYVRDDDFRLSFLQGNFITLTNLTDADIERIDEERLSPLYVSLHATTPSVREHLVCAREDRALERLDELLERGIDVHVQIVLVPGVNDGDELERTLTWLAEREGIVSVGVVPVGYTRHQEVVSGSFNDPIDAALVIQQVQRWQFAMRERDGVTWVHLADEFYLNARAPFPTSEWYDGFPQYENGIGLVRSFGDEAAALRGELESAVRAVPEGAESVTLVTGVMAATTLAGALDACDAAGRVRLLVVPNRFFGGNVAVTGLLTASDLVPAIRSDHSRLESPTTYLLPDIVFNDDGLTLDDASAASIRSSCGADVRVVSCDARGLLEGLTGVAACPPTPIEE